MIGKRLSLFFAAGIDLIILVQFGQFVPGPSSRQKAISLVLAILGAVAVAPGICKYLRVASGKDPLPPERASLSTKKDYWKAEIAACKVEEAFKYFQTKYFHQDRLMWSRLQLFFAIQAAMLSVGLTSSRSTACVILVVGLIFAAYIAWLFMEDDMYRRAARVAMEEAGSLLLVPIVGKGGVYSQPTMTKNVLLAILGVDGVFYLARSIFRGPLLG